MSLPIIITRLLLYTALFVGIYAAMAFDAQTASYGEASLTEYAQEALLLIIALLSFYSAKAYPVYRVLGISLGVLAVVSLIRELNNYAYEYLFPNAWFLGVLLVLIPYLVYLFRNLRRFVREITTIADSYSFAILLIGGLVLHVFSRLYGLPYNWKNIMGDQYMHAVTRISEESIELLGYSILFIGAVEFVLFARRALGSPIRTNADSINSPI